tara:strand:- start:177 stop:356 length:180 start_codon:yes stop_codon:yes gene_type:complete
MIDTDKYKIRFEIMTMIESLTKANEIGDKLYEYLENTLGYDCALVIIEADTDTEVKKND